MTADHFKEERHGREKCDEFREIFGKYSYEAVYTTLERLLDELKKAGLQYNTNFSGSRYEIQREFIRASLAYIKANDLAQLYDFIAVPADGSQGKDRLMTRTYPAALK